MSHPYIDSFLKYRNYRIEAAAKRRERPLLSGKTLAALGIGVGLAYLANVTFAWKIAIAATVTLLGLAIDMMSQCNPNDFLNKYANQLDPNFRACLQGFINGRIADECGFNFSDNEIAQMAEQLVEANKQQRLFAMTPTEMLLLPSKVIAKMKEIELSPLPVARTMRRV